MSIPKSEFFQKSIDFFRFKRIMGFRKRGDNVSSYETKKIFSENLSRLLEEHGKTQLDLSNEMHVAASTVSSWCNGDKMPRMDKVEWMASYFGVQTSQLIEPPEQRDNDIKAALWGGDKDLSQEDIDALWDDVRAYAEFKTQQRKKNQWKD